MSKYILTRNNCYNSLIILLIILDIIGKVDVQSTKFQIISNKDITDQEYGSFLKISARTIDKLLCLSYCPRVDCNLVSYNANNNQCRLYSFSLSVLQQTGLSFINSPGTNLFISKPYIDKPFNGSFKKIISIHQGSVYALIKLSSGELVSGSHDTTIKIFNVDGTVKHTLQGTAQIGSIAEIPNTGCLAIGSVNVIQIWNMKSGSPVLLRSLNGHIDIIWTLLYIQSVSKLASGSGDQTIKIWDPINGILLNTLTGHTSWLGSLALLPNGDLVSGGGDPNMKIWNVTNFNKKFDLFFVAFQIWSILVLQNGNVASGYSDSKIRIWRPIDRILIQTLSGHTAQVSSLNQFSNGDLVSGGCHGQIRVLNLETGFNKIILNKHTNCVTSIIILDNGDLASSSYDSNIIIWG